jgi:PhnB protein
VKSKEEAIEWLKRAPFDQTEVEIRQVYEMADFAPSDPTGEFRKHEQKLRDTVEARRR